VEVVASLSQGRTAAAQCSLFTHKSVPVIFEPPCKFYLCRLKPSSVILLPRCIVENICVKIHVLKCVTFYYWLLIEICLVFNILAHAKDSAPVESHLLHMALWVPFYVFRCSVGGDDCDMEMQ